MLTDFNPIRYAIIHEKNPREIVMLRGSGCQWRRCRFCDYHLDANPDPLLNYALNADVLSQITGCYHTLEVINSGSFIDLDEQTLSMIEQIALTRHINVVHFECHWQHRQAIEAMRKRFAYHNINLKIKIGVESFDQLFRESYLDKGIDTDNPQHIAQYFDEVCLLQGIPGQTVTTMTTDIELGLQYFQRICVNIMQANSKPVKPDPRVITLFATQVYPYYQDNPRVDILMKNTAFGVGGVTIHDQ